MTGKEAVFHPVTSTDTILATAYGDTGWQGQLWVVKDPSRESKLEYSILHKDLKQNVSITALNVIYPSWYMILSHQLSPFFTWEVAKLIAITP